VPQVTVDALVTAYQAYRVRTHHLSLMNQTPIVASTEFVAERASVTRIWNQAMADDPAPADHL
jgi:hypothetical protein